jgi:hypothetical protein
LSALAEGHSFSGGLWQVIAWQMDGVAGGWGLELLIVFITLLKCDV